MIEIKYISSNGKEYNLIGEKMRVKSGNYHKYSWGKEVQKSKIGERLLNFTKDPALYGITLIFRGDLEERKEKLDNLRDDFEYDVLNQTAGKFIFGKYYISGFVTESETKVSSIQNNWTEDNIEIYCPYPFWIKETEYHFKTASVTSTGNKQYPYKYPYRYANGMKDAYVINGHIAPVHFKLRIYGPCANPFVVIGGHTYRVQTILETGEYLEIDSMSETVIKTKIDGTKVNVFHYRSEDCFKKILPGKQTINWPGQFDFDLILFEERSEPKWQTNSK